MGVVSIQGPATGARERLVAFVAEMAAGMAHPRQRANALVYVRGSSTGVAARSRT